MIQALFKLMQHEVVENLKAFTNPALDHLLGECERRLRTIERLAGLRGESDPQHVLRDYEHPHPTPPHVWY